MSFEKVSEKISSLSVERAKLKSTLTQKGIVAADNDKLPTLLSKVREIEDNAYALEGITMLVSTSYNFSLHNLGIKPYEVGFISRELQDAYIMGAGNGWVVPDLLVVFEEGIDTITVDDCDVTRIYDETSGTWSVVFSFERHNNEDPSHPKRFQGGYTYTWLVLSHALYTEEVTTVEGTS